MTKKYFAWTKGLWRIMHCCGPFKLYYGIIPCGEIRMTSWIANNCCLEIAFHHAQGDLWYVVLYYLVYAWRNRITASLEAWIAQCICKMQNNAPACWHQFHFEVIFLDLPQAIFHAQVLHATVASGAVCNAWFNFKIEICLKLCIVELRLILSTKNFFTAALACLCASNAI